MLACISIKHATSALDTETETLLQPAGPDSAFLPFPLCRVSWKGGRTLRPCSLTAPSSRELASAPQPTEAVPTKGAVTSVLPHPLGTIFLQFQNFLRQMQLLHSVLGNLSDWLPGSCLFCLPHLFLFSLISCGGLVTGLDPLGVLEITCEPASGNALAFRTL